MKRGPSFLAKRLARAVELLAQVEAEGRPMRSYADQIRAECARLAAGLIGGFDVES